PPRGAPMRAVSWIWVLGLIFHAAHPSVVEGYGQPEPRSLPPASSLGRRIDEKDANGKTRLMFAIMNGRLPRAYELLAAGASPEAADLHGRTPLMMAAKAGYDRLVRAMLKAGAHPNLQNEFSSTALFVAAENGKAQAVRELLKGGADPEIRGWGEATA